MDEKEFEILWEKIRKIDRNMADLFDERVELTRRTAISKIEANIPVYDAKGEEKNVEELSALLQKMSNRFRFIRWYHLLTEPGKWHGKNSGRERRNDRRAAGRCKSGYL